MQVFKNLYKVLTHIPISQVSIAKGTDRYTMPAFGKQKKTKENKGWVQDSMESRAKLLRVDAKGTQKRQRRESTYYSPELQTIISNCLLQIFTWMSHRQVKLNMSKSELVIFLTHPELILLLCSRFQRYDTAIQLFKPDKIILVLSLYFIHHNESNLKSCQYYFLIAS